MKELDKYLGEMYSDICQPDIMTETPPPPDPYMPTTIHDLGIKHPKIDVEITYLEENNTDESILQNMSKKDVYESEMHNIYNLIVVKKDEN